MGARVGRVAALTVTGVAVLWVVGVSLSVVADHGRTVELVVIAIQAAIALGIQTFVIWRFSTGWWWMSNARDSVSSCWASSSRRLPWRWGSSERALRP